MAVYRMTLTLGLASSGREVAESAARLAAAMGAALDALFVEERKLMRLAQSQLLRRVRMPSCTLETPGLDELEAELRLHEAALRRMIDDAARRAGIEWSFRTVVDEPVDAPIAIDCDLAIVAADGLLAHRREFVTRLFARTMRLLVVPPRFTRIAHPALVVEAARLPLHAAQLAEARDFARRFAANAPLTLLLLGERADAGDLPGEVGTDPSLTLRRLPATADLAALLAAPPAGIDALVLPLADASRRVDALDAILARTSVPTLLLLRDDTASRAASP